MSHRSYQTALPCGNKFLQKKWDDAYYEEHKRRLRDSKPVVNTKAPPRQPHVIRKLKKQQAESERADIIDRDNSNLLQKMQRIMKTRGGVDHRNTYQHHSLNAAKRQLELERVAQENKAMLHRLQTVKPMYRVNEWVEDWQRNAKLTEMITTFPSTTASCKVGKKPKLATSVQPPLSAQAKEKPSLTSARSNDDVTNT